MPFLRFTRDKRGYENTFLMHAGRSRGRKHPRVLYWFRTPPGVRVGRSALDEEAIHTIEASHPDIYFDWTSILQQRPVDEAPRPQRTAALPSRRDKKRDARPQPLAPSSPPVVRAAGGSADLSEAERVREPERIEDDVPVAASREVMPAATDTDVDVDAGIDRDDESAEREDEMRPIPMLERHPALEDLVGVEGVARLRARFSELRARIAEQPDAEALRAEAEILNPDTWVTAEEARLGLESFEAGFEAIRRKLPSPRRRRRRGRRSIPPDRRDDTSTQQEKPATETEPGEGRGPTEDV